MTSVANPNPIPPGPLDFSARDPSFDNDVDELPFMGMWCTPVDTVYAAEATITSYVPDGLVLERPLRSVIER
jgi:hypothetical protein